MIPVRDNKKDACDLIFLGEVTAKSHSTGDSWRDIRPNGTCLMASRERNGARKCIGRMIGVVVCYSCPACHIAYSLGGAADGSLRRNWASKWARR